MNTQKMETEKSCQLKKLLFAIRKKSLLTIKTLTKKSPLLYCYNRLATYHIWKD